VTERNPRAPVVVLAVGNDARGDDGLGPALAALLEAEGRVGVDVVVDYQLQIEHALALEGRRLAVFVDAGHGTPPPFTLERVAPAAEFLHTTHALPAAAVLETARRLGIALPEARVLCISGASFGLGEGLSPVGTAHLAQARAALGALLDAAAGA